MWLPGSGIRYRNDVHTALLTATQLVSTSHPEPGCDFRFARYMDRRTDLQPSVYVTSRAGYSHEGATLGPYGFGADPEDTYEGADTLSLTSDRHAVKAGRRVRSYVRAHNEAMPYGRGAYYFAGAPAEYPQPYAFVQASPTTVEARPSIRAASRRSRSCRTSCASRARLTLNYGLRYDIEKISNVEQLRRRHSDCNNLQPRFERHRGRLRPRILGARRRRALHAAAPAATTSTVSELEGPDGLALITPDAASRR